MRIISAVMIGSLIDMKFCIIVVFSFISPVLTVLFYVLISHLCINFREISIHILCSFSSWIIFLLLSTKSFSYFKYCIFIKYLIYKNIMQFCIYLITFLSVLWYTNFFLLFVKPRTFVLSYILSPFNFLKQGLPRLYRLGWNLLSSAS